MQVTIHTDGGALNNPGPAAIGAVIETPNGKKTYAQDIGTGTNNEAEYKALIFALKKAKSLIGGEKAKEAKVSCYSDSELMVSQLNHKYHLKNTKIIELFVEVWNLMLSFDKVEFNYVPREENREADALVKSILNGKKQNSFF